MSKWRGPRKGFEREGGSERYAGKRDSGRTVESKTGSRGPSKGTSTDDAKYQQKKEDLKRKASSYRDRKSGRATGLDTDEIIRRDKESGGRNVKPELEEGNRGGRRYKPAQRDDGRAERRDPDRSKRAGRDLERRLNRRSGAQDRDKQKANYRDKESGRATGLDKSGLKEPRRSRVSRLKARLRRRRARRRMR